MAKDVLSDEQIEKMILAALSKVARAGRVSLWDKLTHDSGPYEITVVNEDTLRLFKAFLAAAEPVIREDERERCAAVCDDKERRKWHILTEGGALEGFGPLDCAAAIRQLGAGSKGDADAPR